MLRPSMSVIVRVPLAEGGLAVGADVVASVAVGAAVAVLTVVAAEGGVEVAVPVGDVLWQLTRPTAKLKASIEVRMVFENLALRIIWNFPLLCGPISSEESLLAPFGLSRSFYPRQGSSRSADGRKRERVASGFCSTTA